MAVKIKRESDWNAMGTLKVKLDGEEVDRIKYFEGTELELPAEQAELRVSNTLVTSNKVTVSDENTVHISVRYLNIALLPIIMFAMMMAPNFLSVEGVGLRMLVMLPFIPLFFLIGIGLYRLEVVEREPEDGTSEGNS